ncbi:MAG: radical SAM/SPASM domain-containing protein [Candidatus Helarchaeales archaeon]
MASDEISMKITSQWTQYKIPLTYDGERLERWINGERGPIYYLMFGITYECQLKCPHCCVGNIQKEKPRELSTEEIKAVLNQSSKTFVVNFFGGEPTLRPDLIELIKYASEKSVYVFLTTNGLRMTREYARQLKESGLEMVYISVDSSIPERHDQSRGLKGMFQRTMQAIKNAIDAGLKCLFCSYVTSETLNNGEFEGIINLAKDVGATGVRYLFPIPAGRWLHNLDIIMTPEDEERVKQLAEFPFVHRDFYFQNQDSSQCRGLSEKLYVYISPYGDVQPCSFIPLSFGNVRDEPLIKILDRMWNHPMFSDPCISKECPMLNIEFRKKYIDHIDANSKLPIKMY